MIRLSKRAREIRDENRAAAGMPVLTCPKCGASEAHWVPDTLDDATGLVISGYFICGAGS